MDNDIIQAYLWQKIIRIGFSPSGNKNIKSWLRMYGQSLKDFWEIDDYPPNPKSNGTIIAELSCIASLNIALSYNITNITKFAVTFSPFLPFSDRSNKLWIHDVDGSYFAFPERSLLLKYNRSKEAIKKILSEHIEKVLDGLIFHPTAHQHIKTDFHSIRIGGGIHNPFLYLFHLRYQLCPDETRRDEEKKRLISLFESAVKRGTSVTANELLLAT
ncbi:MAG: hypothetical protein KKE12_17220 [Proteobacteria bacterium]|nr:hypothetical protein [Pseudomonadota bacterium]